MGRDLIAAAEIRAQITQFREYDVAIRTFSLKYNALPGDIDQANSIATGLNFYSAYGDNNGIINQQSGVYPAQCQYLEPMAVFAHLYTAGLVRDSFSFVPLHYAYEKGEQFPHAKLGNGGFLLYSKSNTKLAYFFGLNVSKYDGTCQIKFLSTGGVISPINSYQIDTKIDDGLPNTGRVRSATVSGWDISNNTSDDNCSTYSTNKYIATNYNPDCRLSLDIQ